MIAVKADIFDCIYKCLDLITKGKTADLNNMSNFMVSIPSIYKKLKEINEVLIKSESIMLNYKRMNV